MEINEQPSAEVNPVTKLIEANSVVKRNPDQFKTVSKILTEDGERDLVTEYVHLHRVLPGKRQLN